MENTRITTLLTEKLGIRHPIIQAPMALVAGGKLTQAVSQSGGLGLLGGGYGDKDWIENELKHMDTNQCGIGFITWRLQENPKLLDIALDYKPKAIMLSFGDISPFSHKIHAANSLIIAQVQEVSQAIHAKNSGADIIVAQGTEAGGHCGTRSTLPLVSAIVDQVGKDIPVVAAGGIADGRGLAAALMLGASGILMGSRFYASQESLAHQSGKVGAVSATGDSTMRSSLFDHLRGFKWPEPYQLRSLKNPMLDKWHDNFDALTPHFEEQSKIFKHAFGSGDFTQAPLIVGECVDMINDIPTTEDIITNIIRDAVDQLKSAESFLP